MRRFNEKLEINEKTGCYEWTAHIDRLGYARFWLSGTMTQAHRVAYELAKGYIPEGLVIDHLCRVRHCVNPEHLEVVTQAENCRRGDGGKHHARKTHCPQGHEYLGENLLTVERAGGGTNRVCLTCKRESLRRGRARRKLGQ